MQIVLDRGLFAIELSPSRTGWFYLLEGEAVIRTLDGLDIPVSGGQMVALSDQFVPVPVLYEDAAVAVLNLDGPSTLRNEWEPTLGAQIRDRLAFIGISVAQVVTFVTYMSGLIVIMALVIGGIYSVWQYLRKPQN